MPRTVKQGSNPYWILKALEGEVKPLTASEIGDKSDNVSERTVRKRTSNLYEDGLISRRKIDGEYNYWLTDKGKMAIELSGSTPSNSSPDGEKTNDGGNSGYENSREAVVDVLSEHPDEWLTAKQIADLSGLPRGTINPRLSEEYQHRGNIVRRRHPDNKKKFQYKMESRSEDGSPDSHSGVEITITIRVDGSGGVEIGGEMER